MKPIRKIQQALKELGLMAVIIEPGAAMVSITGVRWGRSERTFALIIPQKGEPAYVLPAFEEKRARELIPAGTDIRLWQEDQNPFAAIVQVLRDRGVSAGRIGLEDTVRFFVFDGIRSQAPEFEYVSWKV